MERIAAIIRINYKELDHELEDLRRFNNHGIKNTMFRIPKVTVLKRTIKGAHEFQEKPLLFNYGFLDIPLEYAVHATKLMEIKMRSKIIMGFFFRNPDSLKLERAMAEQDGLEDWHPILVKSITEEEVERLLEVAREVNVYDSVEQLAIGGYVVLKGYPFDGMGAKIIHKKVNGKIQVELVDSGMKAWLEKGNIYYTAYTEDEYLNLFT